MASSLPPGHRSAATTAETARESATVRPGQVFPSLPARHQILIFLGSLLLLHGSNPLAWGRLGTDLWFPPAGIGLALIAWFGPRVAVWWALDCVVVVAQALVLSRYGGGQVDAAELILTLINSVLGVVLLFLAWKLYQTHTRSAHDLHDPKSAKRFLFLVPCLGVGTWAGLHTILGVLLSEQSVSAWRSDFLAFWLSRALSVMILTPFFLVLLTPWLTRHGLVRPQQAESDPSGGFDVSDGGERFSWGEGLELLGLVVVAGALTWLAVQDMREQQSAGWQLWGAPLLLIVWASLRQGLRGGMAVASLSAGLSLIMLQGQAIVENHALFIQGNLLSQCAFALLAASSFGWVRINERRYRQVAASLPVVFYSARFCRPDRPPLSASDRDAEVTRVSAASEALIGCLPRELLGELQRWLAHIHAEDRDLLRAAIAQLGRYGQSVTCEYRIVPPQTETRLPESEIRKERGVSDFLTSRVNVRWVRDTLAPHWDSEGRLLGWEGVLTDITEQRTLADDLRRTTHMLHALVDNLPTGVFFVQGPSGHPILVNARARQLLGQREDMAAGLEHLSEVYRLHRPDGSPYPVEDLPVYLALRRGLTAMRDDIVVHRPDGRRTPLVAWAAPIHCPLSASLNPLVPASSAPNGRRSAESGSEAAVWVMEDLTALHQAEAARRDTEIRLRAILETMSEGVVVQDKNGCVIDSNAAASAILGQTPEKLRGKNLADCDWRLMREDGTLLAEADYPAAVVLRMGRPVRNLVLAIVPRLSQSASPDEQFKEVRWVLINAMPLAAASTGELPAAKGVVSTYIDISPTIRAQRMLRESEAKYRDLVESLPLMVIQADTDLHVTYANPATHRVTGYEQNEITEPAMWGRLVHPDDLPKLLTMAQQALSGQSARAEYRYRAKDGSEKVGLAFSEPRRRSDGTIIGTTTLIADVTRERQLEQELLRAQRVELVGRLAGGIAHDFNNLLSVVLSMADLARASLPPGHSAREDLGRIEEATQQAANLVHQLLSFSKQRRIATRRIDINDTVARTLDLLRATLPSRIELKAELAQSELFVRADETQVQQVVMNLCLNARDAMPNGGLLEVGTALVSAEEKWICLSVRDNGMGMTEDVKAHLFDPFFSTKERGTGLGLAVVRHIIESHGGRVEVASEPDKGARFDVWWPACRDGESSSSDT